MGTALIYLVVLLGVAAAFFLCATAVFGRGEELAPVPPTATPTWLPEPGRDVGSGDVRALRFQQAVRGYKMAEVDWALERLALELDQVRGELDDARGRIAELESASAARGAEARHEPRSRQRGSIAASSGERGADRARRRDMSPGADSEGASRRALAGEERIERGGET
jgi:DivIVA domain-containing protein